MSEGAITDKIDFSKSEQYTLSIRLSADGFSFSIYNPILDSSLSYIPQQVKTDTSMSVNVRELLKSDILRYAYKRINILQVERRFTLVPLEYAEVDKDYNTCFYYNHLSRENEKILCNELRKASVKVLFGMDKSAWQQLSDRFPTACFYSHASPLIEYFAGKCRLGNSRKMYVYLRGTDFEVFCFDRGHLLLANSFSGNHVDDYVYYLLYVWKQLAYDQERDELHVVGTITDKEQLIANLRRFIHQVFVINPQAEFVRQGLTKLEDVPFDLQILSLCEI